jgi:hypothetical protein
LETEHELVQVHCVVLHFYGQGGGDVNMRGGPREELDSGGDGAYGLPVETARRPRGRMMRATKTWFGVLAAVAILWGGSADAAAQAAPDDEVVLGVKVRFGGRYDDVRMCVASDPGVKGGIAADVSFFMEFGVHADWALHVDLPVFRPILFAASFGMLQFEPAVTAKYRVRTGGSVDVLVGPTLGLSMHYGPDYRSASSGAGRSPSFFAMGPTVGGYVGLDFLRPGKAFNFQIGVSPYVSPLFSIGDPAGHRGVVAGGLVDALFRWDVR